MSTEAETVAELALKSAGLPVVVKTNAGREFLIAPGDRTVQDVTERGAIAAVLPKHVVQGVTLQTVDSLVDYVNAFKTPTTVLLADISANTIRAVLDYHAAAEGEAAPRPDYGQHIASMVLPFSEEWRAWAAIDGKLMAQLEFARFIEENAADIVAPSGADLLEVCRDLQARRTVDFRKAVRTNTDNEKFEYSDETTATSRSSGQAVEVPTRFKLEIPVYFGLGAVTLFANLRWRLDETKLLLGVSLHRAEHVRQAVFQEIVGAAGTRTDRLVMFGKLDARSGG